MTRGRSTCIAIAGTIPLIWWIRRGSRQEGSLGLGESYMDGWWECERLDIFFHKVLRAGLEKQLPHHFKDTLRIAGARLFNLQSKKSKPPKDKHRAIILLIFRINDIIFYR